MNKKAEVNLFGLSAMVLKHPFLKNRVRQTAPGQGRLTISGIALTDYKILYFKTWAKSKAILVSHCLTRVGYAFNVYES